VEEVPTAATAVAAPPPDPGARELTAQEKGFTLAAALLGMFLAALDQTVVTTAGPAIKADLAMDDALYGWITTAYMVASTVMVPIYGKLSDLLGRKPILLTGMSIFLVGSIGCGLSPTWQLLLASRAVQGLGAAALFTTAFAVIADLFPPSERGKYTGYFAGVWGVTSVFGPFLGGFLTDGLSWHWVFFINLPIGLVAIAFVLARMPKLAGGIKAKIDLPGALALAVFVVPFLIALTLGSRPGEGEGGTGTPMPWDHPLVLTLFAVSAVGLIAFVAIERRAPEPLLDLRLFKGPVFRAGVLAMFVIGMAFFAAIVFVPLYLITVDKLSATDTGLALTPMTLGTVTGNVLAGQIVSRTGRYKTILLGSLVGLAGAFALVALTIEPGGGVGVLAAKLVLVGLMIGPSIPVYTIAIQNSVPPQQVGVVTGAATFSRQVGGTIGMAVLMTVFASVFGRALAGGAVFAQAMTQGVVAVFWAGAVMAVLALLITLGLPELPLRTTNR
jgi:EmrB/QacA subfamily drug resistance transporter